MVFISCHKPPSLISENGGVGGWGRVRNFKWLSLGYDKEIKGFFLAGTRN